MAVGRRMTQADLSPQNYLENKKKENNKRADTNCSTWQDHATLTDMS